MRDKKTKVVQLSLALIALISIGMGLLKIYSHYVSIFRYGPLDYIVAIGAIVGGIAVLSSKRSNAISLVCIAFLAFEVLKAIVDFRDFNDVLLSTIGIICLLIPVIRYATTIK